MATTVYIKIDYVKFSIHSDDDDAQQQQASEKRVMMNNRKLPEASFSQVINLIRNEFTLLLSEIIVVVVIRSYSRIQEQKTTTKKIG